MPSRLPTPNPTAQARPARSGSEAALDATADTAVSTSKINASTATAKNALADAALSDGPGPVCLLRSLAIPRRLTTVECLRATRVHTLLALWHRPTLAPKGRLDH
jgi:hypothetical protein